LEAIAMLMGIFMTLPEGRSVPKNHARADTSPGAAIE
jgi:hypothetical protein